MCNPVGTSTVTCQLCPLQQGRSKLNLFHELPHWDKDASYAEKLNTLENIKQGINIVMIPFSVANSISEEAQR